MKKIVYLLFLVLFVCACSNNEVSNENKQIIKVDSLNVEDKAMLYEQSGFDYNKFSLNWKTLNEKGIKRYTIYVEQYENQKKINNSRMNVLIDKNVDEGFEFVNNYYGINNCEHNKCDVDFIITKNNIVLSSLNKSSEFKNFYNNVDYLTISYLKNDEIGNEDIKVDKEIILYSVLFNKNDRSGSLMHDNSIKEIINSADALNIFYLKFYDK